MVLAHVPSRINADARITTTGARAANTMTRTPPTIEAEIVAARSAGWTVTAIAGKTGASPSTIKRICARHKVKPGEDQAALVTAARKELLSTLTDDEKLRAIYAGLIADTCAHVALGREKAAEAVAMLTATDTKSAALVLRGLAAYSTAIKNGADTVRSLIPAPQADPDELPILQVVTLTDEEIQHMRDEQRQEEAVMNGDDLDDTDEVDAPDVVEC